MKHAVLSLAGFFILIAIILGAFGAHSLENHLSSDELNSIQTGIQYQLFHGLTLLILGFHFDKVNKAKLITTGIISGTILFSGSIYVLTLDQLLNVNTGFLWPLTPIGGLVLIFSWLLFAIVNRKNKLGLKL